MARAAVLTCALLAFGGPGASTAQAHYLRQHHGESDSHYAHRVVWHAQTGIKWIKTHAKNYKKYPRYREALRNHRWLLRFGKELQRRYAVLFRPPHYNEWMCIHRYEGSWDDDGAPFWGGLQMDWAFMRAYGGRLLREKGTANNWTPLEQMWVAENALRAGRGFYPWPNTARMCGLI